MADAKAFRKSFPNTLFHSIRNYIIDFKLLTPISGVFRSQEEALPGGRLGEA
jgi:hypothetical protein